MTLLVHSLEELQMALKGKKDIGFVPTMGALHDGHATLLRECKRESETCVLSVFVNPTQFGPNEDFSKYPRTLEEDLKIAKTCGVDVLFAPSAETVYPKGWNTFIEVKGLSDPWCGAYRPGHFRGVATVVYRLFSLVKPKRAYFGQKDLQQCLVLQRMVSDLDLPIELIIAATVREEDGLAKSSRNRYLSPEERKKAAVIFRALNAAERIFSSGERNTRVIEECAETVLKEVPEFQIQYCDLRSFPDLEKQNRIDSAAALAIAGFLGKTRLIDNILLG